MENNSDAKQSHKKVSLIIAVFVLLAIIVTALYFLLSANNDTGTSLFDDGIANPRDRFLAFIEDDVKKNNNYSYHNRGYIKEVDLPLDRGTYTCSFFVYDDYVKGEIGLDTSILDIEGDTRFIVVNQAQNGQTAGVYDGRPALFVNKIDNAYTYIKHNVVESKGKNDPIKVLTRLEDYAGFYITCFDAGVISS